MVCGPVLFYLYPNGLANFLVKGDTIICCDVMGYLFVESGIMEQEIKANNDIIISKNCFKNICLP